MNRRNFLKATAATLLGLLPWAKGRREPVAEGIIVVNGMALDDLGPEAAATLEGILHTYAGFDVRNGTAIHPSREPFVFQGLEGIITTGHQDAERLLAQCDCPFEFEVTWGDCDE